ncbi:unnamed protein product [Danaus chrysippus]|uniref:(African queen) hypothetical protein n=1 Tax=Danaus chrysippus TaxID=151541 RepID=A0A8J2QLS5_9NEOP|nr:unnamed protein product [Danaus chrysippus]
MSKWKLCRQTFGNDEFELKDGEVTIGRGVNNTIKFTSIFVSRNHCLISVNQDEVVITDLKSSNGVYVGEKKIPPGTPYILSNNDIIGFGWATVAPQGNIKDDEKHVYKLIKNVPPEKKLKRKLDTIENIPSVSIVEYGQNSENSSNDSNAGEMINRTAITSLEAKKPKLEPNFIDLTEDQNDDLQHGLIKNKQDYYIINEEPEIILSDSDYEAEHRYVRISESLQNPPIKMEKKDTANENSIYSQQDDAIEVDSDEVEEVNEPEQLEKTPYKELPKDDTNKQCIVFDEIKDSDHDDIVIYNRPSKNINLQAFEQIDNNSNTVTKSQIQEINIYCGDNKESHEPKSIAETSSEEKRIEEKSSKLIPTSKVSASILSKTIEKSKDEVKQSISKKKKSNSLKKPTLTDSQKKKRRQKLKEICEKEIHIVTTESIANSKIHENSTNSISTNKTQNSKDIPKLLEIEEVNNKKYNKIKPFSKPKNPIQIIEPHVMQTSKKRIAHNKVIQNIEPKDTSDINMRNSHKTSAVVHNKDVDNIIIAKQNQRPVLDNPRVCLSLKKKVLMKILTWNPSWLEEQKQQTKPPPILNDKKALLTLFLSFDNYKRYVRQMENLLLIEIWECLTQEFNYLKERKYINLQIETLPLKPPQERSLLMSTINMKLVPRHGDIMILKFRKCDKENSYKLKFCFIHKIDHISSYNRKTIVLSCYVTYSDLFESLQPGDELTGDNITYIHKELAMFEAMELLEKSPLRDVILKPEPSQYTDIDKNKFKFTESQWTASLNDSQKRAVAESVSAALDSQPVLRMIQGPPGTGKSKVICSIVMAYFYGNSMKKQSKRGKILICATSNAAVDELVIRLLNLRNTLVEEERFRLVRVGRLESMHRDVRDVSTQTLAHKHARREDDSDVTKEIARNQAIIDRWKAEKATDPARAAYCHDRAKYFARQIELLRGGDVRPGRLMDVERRLVEEADIVATTLASSVNHKMRGLRGVELCIVDDEAGQAIEPETLLPLMLGVNKMTLVGDPQQLPGYICSERAKTHGLDRSLFSRLAEYSACWERRPLVLLDRQYRMHPAIADYPNRAFYGGRVQSEPPPTLSLHLPPYCILDIPGSEHDEAWGAARVALAVYSAARAHQPQLSVAIITPYVAHRDLLRKYLLELDECGRGVEVNTVDSFQGQERDLVVVSLGRRQGVGFLAHAGRMNVLLTRARHMLILCLYKNAVDKHEQWRTLLRDAEEKNLFKTLPSYMCRPGGSSARQASSKEVLEFLRSKKNKHGHK